MKAVGQFIGLGADQARLYFIDGADKHFSSHTFQLPREQFFQFSVYWDPECLAAADDVLKEPRLGLMHAHGGSLSGRCLA